MKVAEISLGFLLILRKFLNISAFNFYLFSFHNLNKFCTFEDHFKMLSYWTRVTCCKMYRLFLQLFVTWLKLEKRNTVGNKLRSVGLSLPHLTCLQSAFSLKIRGPFLFSASAIANNDVTINSLARFRRSRAWVTRGVTL